MSLYLGILFHLINFLRQAVAMVREVSLLEYFFKAVSLSRGICSFYLNLADNKSLLEKIK